MLLTDLSCGDSGRGLCLFSNVGHPRDWMLGWGALTLWVKKMLVSDLLLLEGNDGRECHENFKICTPCHPELVIVPQGFRVLCVERKKEWLLCFCMISVNVVGTWNA